MFCGKSLSNVENKIYIYTYRKIWEDVCTVMRKSWGSSKPAHPKWVLIQVCDGCVGMKIKYVPKRWLRSTRSMRQLNLVHVCWNCCFEKLLREKSFRKNGSQEKISGKPSGKEVKTHTKRNGKYLHWKYIWHFEKSIIASN